jgi:hypothetical protein
MRFNNGTMVRVKRGTYSGKEGRIIRPHATLGEAAYLIEGVQESIPEYFLEKVKVEDMFFIDDGTSNVRIKHAPGNMMLGAYPNDNGNTPHFHFYRDPKNIEVFGCFCFCEVKYFSHSTKSPQKNGKMNNSEIKDLIKFLKLPHKKEHNKTNWEVLIDGWNAEGSKRIQVDVKQEIPEWYSDMPTTKDPDHQ